MIQVEHFKWIHINRLLASKNASKWKAHGNTSKQATGKKRQIEKERANKTARVKWGERKTRGKWQIM